MFMEHIKDSHELCHRTHALFKFKQVVVTYIRTLPSTPSQLPFVLGPVPHSGRHKHSRGEAGPGGVQSQIMDMAASSICLLASVSVGVSVRLSVRLYSVSVCS